MSKTNKIRKSLYEKFTDRIENIGNVGGIFGNIFHKNKDIEENIPVANDEKNEPVYNMPQPIYNMPPKPAGLNEKPLPIKEPTEEEIKAKAHVDYGNKYVDINEYPPTNKYLDVFEKIEAYKNSKARGLEKTVDKKMLAEQFPDVDIAIREKYSMIHTDLIEEFYDALTALQRQNQGVTKDFAKEVGKDIANEISKKLAKEKPIEIKPVEKMLNMAEIPVANGTYDNNHKNIKDRLKSYNKQAVKRNSGKKAVLEPLEPTPNTEINSAEPISQEQATKHSEEYKARLKKEAIEKLNENLSNTPPNLKDVVNEHNKKQEEQTKQDSVINAIEKIKQKNPYLFTLEKTKEVEEELDLPSIKSTPDEILDIPEVDAPPPVNDAPLSKSEINDLPKVTNEEAKEVMDILADIGDEIDKEITKRMPIKPQKVEPQLGMENMPIPETIIEEDEEELIETDEQRLAKLNEKAKANQEIEETKARIKENLFPKSSDSDIDI